MSPNSLDPKQAYTKYLSEALAVPTDALLALPADVMSFVAQLRALIQLARAGWERGPDDAPGLKIVAMRYPLSRLDQLDALVLALSWADEQELGLSNLSPEATHSLQRASFICEELEAQLAYLLDDDILEPADEDLAELREVQEALGDSALARVQLLSAWVSMAEREQNRLAQLGDFDPALLAEGRLLITQLVRAVPSQVHSPQVLRELRQARRGLHALVCRELEPLQLAAAYVWRRHPALRAPFIANVRPRPHDADASGWRTVSIDHAEPSEATPDLDGAP
jgi:hypothetical protein